MYSFENLMYVRNTNEKNDLALNNKKLLRKV